MIIRILVCVALMLGTAPAAARADQDVLASAKLLYESASYEAALSELGAIDGAEHADVVSTYRALCLLGLGRTREAERTLETLVTRQPLLKLSESDYSPRVVALFRDVRRRALPQAAQQLYTLARSEYDSKNYESAVAGFRDVLHVIEEVEPRDQTGMLADMRELADGFLTLANGKIVREPVPAAAPPPAAVAPIAKPQPVLYTLLDVQVTPPVVTDQRLPPWRFQLGFTQMLTGQLELVIDETGAVESVTLAEPIWPAYDALLIKAAKSWRYQPAIKDGRPVKFRRVLDISVDPNLRPAR